MAKRDFEILVEASVLDRLIDRDPEAGGDRTITRTDSIREYKAALQRDLEWLLNTRRTDPPEPGRLPELARSLYYYGLPDITSLSRDSKDGLALLTQFIEHALGVFEPRLMNVKATLAPTENTPLAEIRLVVEAVLRLEPSPERITFDTVLHKDVGDLEVGRVSDA